MISPESNDNLLDPESTVAQAMAREPEAPVVEPGPVESLLGNIGDDVSSLEISREASRSVTSDQAARVLRLEMQTGLPGQFIADDVDSIERLAEDRNWSADEFRKSNPEFSSWLAKNPNHYAFAKEDLGFFEKIGRTQTAFKEGIKSVPLMEELAVLVNDEMDGRAASGAGVRIAEIERVLENESRRAKVNDNALAYAARQAGYAGRQAISTTREAVKGAAVGGAGGAVAGSIIPGPGTAFGAAKGAIGGGLMANFVYSYRLERAFAYQDFRKMKDIDGQSLDPDTARTAATAVGVINAIVETGMDYYLARMIPGLSGLISGGTAMRQQVRAALARPTVRTAVMSGLKKLTGGSFMEGFEEVTQGMLQSAGREAAQAASGQTFAPDDLGEDVRSSVSQGIDAMVGTALTFGAGVGGAEFFTQLKSARSAEKAEQFALALSEGVDSKAFQNLPEKAQEAVREIVKDGELSTAYVEPGVFKEFFQKKGLDPREVAAEILGDPQAYDEALASGHEIAIPMDVYARKIAVVPELSNFFSQEYRHAPGAMNARETRELFQRMATDAEWISSEQEFKAEEKKEDSGKQVIDNVVEQLKATGLYDDRIARTMATAYRGFEVLGKQEGIDPAELFKQYGLRILGPDQGNAAKADAGKAGKSFMQKIKDAFGLGGKEEPAGSTEFPKAGELVDGRVVRSSIPNTSSIQASLEDYEVLPGIREVPVIAGDPVFYSASEKARTMKLAEEIRESGEIDPLIIVVRPDGSDYILEGGHRYSALQILKAKSFPALVVSELAAAEAQTDTPSFKKWFGKSKVVDEQGKPMVVYHGTKSPVGEFGESRIGGGSLGPLGNYTVERHGIFAAEDPAMAQEFAEQGGETSNSAIQPLFIRIESPLDLTQKYAYSDEIFNALDAAAQKMRPDEYLFGYKIAREFGDLLGRGELWRIFDDGETSLSPKKWISLLKGLGYDGLVIWERSEGNIQNTKSWVAFDPKQVKSAVGNRGTFDPEDPRILFQGKAVPNARLMALHNLSAENLKFSAEFGGLAVPSLAVTKQGIVHEGFGDVTLIGTQDLADPAKVPVFSTDAYSRRFPEIIWPRVKTSLADKFIDKFIEDTKAVTGRPYWTEVWDELVNHPNRDKAIDAFTRSAQAMRYFLREVKGVGFDAPMRDIPLRASWIDAQFAEEARGLSEAWDALDAETREPGNPGYDAVVSAVKSAMMRHAEKHASEEISAKEYMELLGDPDLGWGVLDGIMGSALRDFGKTEIDRYTAEDQLKKLIEPDVEEYKQWAIDQIKALFSDPKIMLGRKKVPFTLDNVVEAMSGPQQNKEKGMTFGVGATKAAAARKFRSIEDMRRHADTIVSREEGEAAHKNVDDLMDKFRSAAIGYWKYSSTWGALDDAQRALAYAVKNGGTEEAVKRGLRKYDFKVEEMPDDIFVMGADAAAGLKSMVTEYFEAKPQRAVGLSEFAGAVIPKNAPSYVKGILDQAGVPYREYDSAIRDGQAAVISQFVEELQAERGNVLFQPAYHGSPHKFNAFSLHAIGTGEGAQAYGWGLYFAGKKEIASFYRDKLAKGYEFNALTREENKAIPDYMQRQIVARFLDGLNVGDVANGAKAARENIEVMIQDYETRITEERADKKDSIQPWMNDERIGNLNRTLKSLRKLLKSGEFFHEREGRLYEVDIPEDSEYLDWDKNIEEQNEKVKNLADEFNSFDSEFVAKYLDELNADLHGLNGKEFYELLVRYAGESPLPGDDASVTDPSEAASKWLSRGGVSGIKYLDSSSRGAGSGTSNYVVFDDKLVKILGYEQSGDDMPRGRIRFGADRQFNIDLLKDANLSTFLHETGHFYLEVLSDLAARPEASDKVKKDFATILDWLGAKSFDEVTDEMHEKFARGFEAYLMEGKAPSSALRKAFAAFQVWLTHIYRQVVALNVNLTPEVRSVFDRLLATDEEIGRAQAEQSVTPVFSDPVGVLGEKGGKAYMELVGEVRTEAERRLSEKMLAEVKREEEQRWKEERVKIEAEIAADIDTQPVYKALGALESRDPEAPRVKLDPNAIKAMWVIGEETKKKLPRGITAKEGGLHPAVVADMFGFKSAYELLDALAVAEPRREIIERLTTERMADLHGDLMINIADRHDEAMKSVHNDRKAELLRLEAKIFSEFSTQAKDVAYRLSRRPPNSAAVADMARGIIAQKSISAIRPDLYLKAEGKASREAVEATLKKDYGAAFDAKMRELLNHELYRQASAARDDFDTFMEWSRRFREKDSTLAKRRDIALVNAGRAILGKFGIGEVKADGALAYLEQMRKYDQDMYDVISNLIKNAGGVPDLRQAKYSDFVYLKDSVHALWNLSLRTQQIFVDGKLRDRKEIVAELINRLAEIAPNRLPPGYREAVTDLQKFTIGLLGWKAAVTRIEAWVNTVDGGKIDGVFRRYILNPVLEATADYRIARGIYVKKFLEAIKTADFRSGDIDAPELQYIFRGGKSELLGTMLHVGNSSNLSKLLRGMGWGHDDAEGNLDRTRWDAFVSRMQAEGVLTKADYDMLQSVWNLFEELKPESQRVHKDIYGFYFNEITANEIDTPWGKYKGGYVPARTDPFMATDSTIRKEREEIEGGNNSFAFPSTGAGFTKGRVEAYSAPLMKDLRLVPQQIDWILRFIHIQPRVRDIGRVVIDRNFRKALDSFDPAIGGEGIMPWLQRAASQRIETPIKGYGGRLASRAFRIIRGRTGLAIMFGNVVNTLQNVTGFSLAAVKVKPKHLRNALYSYMRAPEETTNIIVGKSKFMATRTSASVIENSQMIEDLILNPSKYDKAQDFFKQHGYFLQAYSQGILDKIVWTGAYSEATEAKMSEAHAVQAADAAVRLTQGSFNAEDMSNLEAGNAFYRAMHMFFSYFNTQANLLSSELTIVARDIGLREGLGRLLYIYLLGFAIPAVLGDAIVKMMAGTDWDEDDDGYLDDILVFFFAAQARTATAMIPAVGPVIQSGLNVWNDKWYDDRITISPAVTALEAVGRTVTGKSVYDAAMDRSKRARAVKDILTTLTIFTGIPFSALSRPLGYLGDVSTGKAEPSGPIDFTRGLVSGRPGEK